MKNPKTVITNFFSSIKADDYDGFYNELQLTYAEKADSKKKFESLKEVFGSYKEIREINEYDSGKIRKDFHVTFVTKDSALVTVKLRLVSETAPFTVDEDGLWGINPNSIRLAVL